MRDVSFDALCHVIFLHGYTWLYLKRTGGYSAFQKDILVECTFECS
jgi:hypothetical protein